MNGMTEACWLTQDFSEALNSFRELLKSSVEEAAIVVVCHDLDGECAFHHSCDGMVNDHL